MADDGLRFEADDSPPSGERALVKVFAVALTMVGGVVALVLGGIFAGGEALDFLAGPAGPPPTQPVLDGRYCSTAGDVVVLAGGRFVADPLSPRFAKSISFVDESRSKPAPAWNAPPPGSGAGSVQWSADDSGQQLDFAFDRLGTDTVGADRLTFDLEPDGHTWMFSLSSLIFGSCPASTGGGAR